MLFVQIITLRWHKEMRFANYAGQRKSVRFRDLPEETAPESALLLHSVSLSQDKAGLHCEDSRVKSYDESAFYSGGHNRSPLAPRLAVTREETGFSVQYFGMGNSTPRTVLTLLPGESGRILLNARRTYHDTGRWYYEQITVNFLDAAPSAYRKKLFFIKEPTHSFSDLKPLQYCG